VRNALTTLPWVEKDSIVTDVPKREVRFDLKDKKGFNENAVRSALKDKGFKELTVKTAPS
jgi:hypothetical protein